MRMRNCFVLALNLMAAVSCFSDEGAGGDGSATPSATGGTSGSEEQGAGGGAGEAPGGAGAGTATGGSSSSSGGAASEDPDDPYCAHAWNGFEQLDIFIEETNAIQLEPDITGATLNAHGDAALDAAELTGQHFGRAQEFVVETVTSEAFDALLLYQETYMVPLAEIAATASDGDAYAVASFTLLQQEGVAEAAAGGALASGTISAYTVERCGRARWP